MRAPTIYIEGLPTVVCDANGVEVSNEVGDTRYTLRMSRHRALNVAALVVSAVSRFEQGEAYREVVTSMPQK